jgi:proline iminopeptidase
MGIDTEEWYLPTTDGATELYIKEIGSGPLVLILHGGYGAEHSYLIDAFAPLFSERRFVFYDQRGSLRSPAKPEAVSHRAHVEDLEHLRSELGIERLTIVGHSMGAFLAMAYLNKYPGHTANVVPMSFFRPKSRNNLTPDELEIAQEQQEAGKAFTSRPEIKELLSKEGLDRDDLSPRDRTRAWRVQFGAVNLYHLERWRQMPGGRIFYNAEAGETAGKSIPNDYNFLDSLKAHDHQITAVIGDHDYSDVGSKLAHLWFDPIENVDLQIVKGAGHCIWLDQPEEFERVTRRALN